MTINAKPKITIITITYNLIKAGRGDYFKQCLRSVHDQTYANIEHLVIDGGSTDGTLEIIKEYKKKGWIEYFSEPDKGIYDAMNKGIKKAKGEYVQFLNSDDYFHDEEGVKKSIEMMQETGVDFCYSPVHVILENGEKIDFVHPHTAPNIASVFFYMPFCHQTMVIKSKVALKEGLFNENYKSAADYDSIIRLCLKRYKCCFLNYEYVTFRWGGVSNTNQEQSLNEISEIYFNNYSQISDVTLEECRYIYSPDYDTLSVNYSPRIPLKLALKLIGYYPYFNFFNYMRAKYNVRINKK